MPDDPIDGVKFSEFTSASPDSADEVVGLHAGDNARFTVASFLLAVRQGLARIFVPNTRRINGADLSSDINLVAGDIAYSNSTSHMSANDVQEAVDELNTGLGGKQATITAAGMLKGDGSGGVTAATPGTDYAEPSDIPSAYTSNPAMDGTADPGTSLNYARGDHVHPSDTGNLGFWLDCGSISSLPVTISDSRITANHSADAWEIGTMQVMGSQWTVTTAAGTVTISGTINIDTTLTSTTLKLHLTKDQ